MLCIFDFINSYYMKLIKVILLFIVLIIACNAQSQVTDTLILNDKIESYTKVRTAGVIVGVYGVAITGLGAHLLYKSMSYDTNDANFYSRGISGTFMTVFGIATATTGIILSLVGQSNIDKYNKKLKNLSAGIIYNGEVKGLSLTYRF